MNRTFCCLSVVLLAGCARSPLDSDEPWAPPRALASQAPAYRPPLEPPDDASSSADSSAAAEPTGDLTLAEAWRLALLKHPALAADAWGVRVAEAKQIQEGASPNPELDVRLDDFAGDGRRTGFDDANLRVRVTQLIELGDKRARRVELARADRMLAAWDYETRRVAVAAQVTEFFAEVVAFQQIVALRGRAVEFAQQMHAVVEDRVKAGGLLPIEREHSAVRLGMASINLKEAQLELEAARRQLAGNWNSDQPRFKSAIGALEIDPAARLDIEPMLALLAEHPQVARFASEIARRQAEVNLARAKAVGDVSVGVGARYFRDNDGHAFLVEFAVPLPIFDRNEGEILEKRFAVARARAQADAARCDARAALIEAHRELSIAHDRASTLGQQVMPNLQSAFDTTQTQFKQGLVKLDDMLDAQRDLLKAQVDRLEALADYHRAAAVIEGLTGRPLTRERSPASAP